MHFLKKRFSTTVELSNQLVKLIFHTESIPKNMFARLNDPYRKMADFWSKLTDFGPEVVQMIYIRGILTHGEIRPKTCDFETGLVSRCGGFHNFCWSPIHWISPNLYNDVWSVGLIAECINNKEKLKFAKNRFNRLVILLTTNQYN